MQGVLANVAAATFLLFGISDLIKLRTGAWWRPTGLLVLKGLCLLSLVACLGVFVTLEILARRRRTDR